MPTPGQIARARAMREAKQKKQAKKLAAAAAIQADNPIDIDGDEIQEVAPRPAVKKPLGRPPKPKVEVVTKPAPTTLRRDPTVQRRVMRDPETGRVMVQGRDGKWITRRVTNQGDKFHIDKADIPEGMTYQWVAMSVMGAEQRNSIASFVMGGWEPVDMSRYPGRYGPANAQGHIIIEGLGLYERPKELTDEARDEEVAAAKSLIRTRNEQFAPPLPEARARRGTELRARRSIEGMPPDIGRPQHEIAVDEGLV